jgi:hypothetical protein
VKSRIRIKNLNPDPHQGDKSNPDPHQGDKSNPDPHQGDKSNPDPHQGDKSNPDPHQCDAAHNTETKLPLAEHRNTGFFLIHRLLLLNTSTVYLFELMQ